MRLRQSQPQDEHERQILSEVERAQKALEQAYSICQRRAASRTDEGSSLRLRYKDTARSLEAVLAGLKGIRGFGAMPEVETPKVRRANADAKR